jgi:uncharacterized protein YgbK (DUF1537 family)
MSILYTFYGDDFTGSTDVLEQLVSNGVSAVLFLGEPTEEHVARFAGVRAIGIAGESRSRTPEWMSEHLPRIFETMRRFGAAVAHYKVCSTFDSAPSQGSIGRAIELGQDVFQPMLTPIVVGAPHLKRYVVFGNLFASTPDGAIERIDRHPMSLHPVTPMREPDLRLHLALQTRRPIGLIDTAMLAEGRAHAALDMLCVRGVKTVLFDTVDLAAQAEIGHLLWQHAKASPIFSASSSGLTAALMTAWSEEGLTTGITASDPIRTSRPLLGVSGSCSAVTERQLRFALDHGYCGVKADLTCLMGSGTAELAMKVVADELVKSLSAGRDTILYTSLGTPHSAPQGDRLGVTLGTVLRDVLKRSKVRRVLLCGGDTASHAVQQLGLFALTWIASLQPGAPLCRAHAESNLNGLELVLKGGQVGTEDFFNVVRGG